MPWQLSVLFLLRVLFFFGNRNISNMCTVSKIYIVSTYLLEINLLATYISTVHVAIEVVPITKNFFERIRLLHKKQGDAINQDNLYWTGTTPKYSSNHFKFYEARYLAPWIPKQLLIWNVTLSFWSNAVWKTRTLVSWIIVQQNLILFCKKSILQGHPKSL